MSQKVNPRQVVTFEELLRACLYEQEALRRVLSILTQTPNRGRLSRTGGGKMSTLICSRCGKEYFLADDKDRAAGSSSLCDTCTPLYVLPEKDPE